MSAKKPIIIGNWKLNHSKKSAAVFFENLKEALKNKALECEIAIAPVSTMLDFAHQQLQSTEVKVSAQDVFYEAFGAYTGEYASEHLQEIGVSYCIVGHSERRRFFHESDEIVAKKAQACLRADLIPICCVGETLQEREEGRMHEVLERQLYAYAKHIGPTHQEVILAYEPVWAIGTGISASALQAQEAQAYVRKLWHKYQGQKAINSTRIVYGGSVNSLNIKELVSMPDVDGALVGGASLQVESFLAMVVQLNN